MFEQELFREFAAASQQLRTDEDVHRKQAELEERIQDRLRDAERERQLEVRKVRSRKRERERENRLRHA